MDLWDIENIVLALSKNEKALEALDKASREKVKTFASDTEKRLKKEAEERKKAEQRRAKEIAERKEKQKRKYCELLGLNIGEWVRNIQNARRFALVARNIQIPTVWGSREGREFCVIDLVRGYMSPYWGYYAWSRPELGFWRERLKKIIDAKTEDELANIIDVDLNFFHNDSHDKGIPFSIVDYSVVGEDMNDIVINGYGPEKTLEQHFNDLKKEFGGK